MKIIAVICALFGVGFLNGVIYAQDFGSAAISFILAAGVFYGSYKLWTKKPKLKKTKNTPVITMDQLKVERVPMNPYVNMKIFETNEPLHPIIYNDLFLKPGEAVFYAIPGRLFHLLNEERVERSFGDYVITNQRALFLGDAESFDIPLNKITAVKSDHFDSFAIVEGKKVHNIMVGDILYGNSALEADYSCEATKEVIQRFRIS